MKLRILSLLIAGIAAGTTLLNAEEPKHCSASAKECEQTIRQMMTGRRYLGLSVVNLKPGIVVKTVVPDSPAERAKFKAGDRLIAVNGQDMTGANVDDFKRMLASARDVGTLFVMIQRRGAYQGISVRLEPYTKAQIDKIIATHLQQSHTTTASAGSGSGQ
ncbi:MAG TPA: PDZ domain-containing protein [Thermoanaerobaculia bacterium]|nr:PDZ domain-containing protein [Thermoanaerobaculia bacterium]